MNRVKKLGAILALSSAALSVNAAVIGGDLLSTADADKLERYLGQGSLDFTNISNLNAGDTATQWHNDVRGHTNVVSIYDITFQGTDYLIGGYSSIGHDNYRYSGDTSNFLFNLTEDRVARLAAPGTRWTIYDQYDSPNYFATFGGGHDLFGGNYILGNHLGIVWDGVYPGQSYHGISYDFGGSRWFDVNTSDYISRFQINGLESYVFDVASIKVSEPASFALLGLVLVGLGAMRRKKTQKGQH